MSLRPYEDTISGTASATGTVSIPWTGLRGTWGSLILIVQATGFPSWTLTKQGRPVGVGRGPNSPIQFPPVLPGQTYNLVGTGLAAGSQVTGDFVGLVSDVGLAELPIAAPSPGTIALDVTTPVSLAHSFGALGSGVGVAISETFLLPPNTLALLVTGGNTTNDAVSVLVTGVQTQMAYGPLGPVLDGSPYAQPLSNPNGQACVFGPIVDGTVTVTITNHSAITAYPAGTFKAYAIADPALVQTLGAGAANQLPTTAQSPNQPPIRVAGSIASGAVLDVLAGASGNVIRGFFGALGVETAVAATPEVTICNHAATTLYHAFSLITAAPPPWQPAGQALASGDGLSLKNQDTAAHVCRGGFALSQGII